MQYLVTHFRNYAIVKKKNSVNNIFKLAKNLFRRMKV